VRAAHEHRDRRSDGLVDVDDKRLLVVPNEHRATTARRNDRSYMNFNDRFAHTPTAYSRLPRAVNESKRRKDESGTGVPPVAAAKDGRDARPTLASPLPDQLD